MNFGELNNYLNTKNCALLCGNGLSMNFDWDFANIMDRLFKAHKELLLKSKFTVKANRGYKEKMYLNYSNVIEYLRNIDEIGLYRIFEEGLKFGEKIYNDNDFIYELVRTKTFTELTFGMSEFTILGDLLRQWKKKGLRNINIEYIPILVYFYYLAERYNKIEEYKLEYNTFIKVVRIGNSGSVRVAQKEGEKDWKNEILENILFNGFNNYYRMLFCTAIFNNGKAIDIQKLSRIDEIDIEKLKCFLYQFKEILTLNYDRILDNILERNLIHLHGEFVVGQKEWCNYQSLSLEYEDKTISFSDILIGDYIYNKVSRAIIHSLAANFQDNKKCGTIPKNIENIISSKKIDTLITFGLNIDNDQHILRNIITGFKWAGIEKPMIIYSYFTKEDKQSFERTFNSVLTFSEELNDYARSIEIKFIDAREIITNCF
ncbi:hypothetical protein ACSW9V_15590 (plasmid) [Clostridium perfringens]|nr:hypothetical protein [Clostridium perfringens]MDU3376309.1 hypothetical protein [Clostridium perfringens]MDU3535951.1 hypothetical protein [Clostridium perfringens]